MNGRMGAAWLAVLSLGLAGCTSTSPSTVDVSSLFSDARALHEVTGCLRDRGWSAELFDGAIQVEVSEDQASAYESDNLECWQEAGIDPDSGVTDEQFETTYAWYSEIADCLKGAGWSVDTRPSIETFRSTYETEPWIPWSQVPEVDLHRALGVCPVMNVQG